MTVPTQRMIDQLNSVVSLSKATTILDVGCGAGNAIAQLISTYSMSINPSALPLATDFSAGMVRQVTQFRKDRLAEMSPGPERDIWTRVTPLRLDAMDLKPLLDDSISHIIANHVFFLTDNPAKAVAESYRVLTPNGALACSSWHKASWINYLAIAAERTLTPLGKTAPPQPQLPAEWGTVEGVQEQLAAAGFKEIQIEYVETSFVLPDVVAGSHAFIASKNPGVTWVTDLLDEDGLIDVEKHFVQVIKENCEQDGEGAYRLVGSAIVAVGRK